MPTTTKQAQEWGWQQITLAATEEMAYNLMNELRGRVPLIYQVIGDGGTWSIWAKAFA